MTIAEQLELKGEKRGLKLGEKLGEQRGLKLGEQRGLKLGEQRGLKLGEQRGLKLGEQRGLKLGEQRGEVNAKKEFALSLLADGVDLEKVAKWTGFSTKEVQALLPKRDPRSD